VTGGVRHKPKYTMIRAALASLVGRRLTPPPSDDIPSPRPLTPTFIGRRVAEPYTATTPTRNYLIEHGATPTLFTHAIDNDLDGDPRLRSVIIRALYQYMDDHGPIGEGRVIVHTGAYWIASFRIEENPRGSVRLLYLVNAGPDASIVDWPPLQ
jgi:hypothetical protein